jgi:hypothetical protein
MKKRMSENELVREEDIVSWVVEQAFVKRSSENKTAIKEK